MTDPQEQEPPPPKAEPPKEVEVVKATFIEVFGDRFKSHSLGGFALAWIAIHWKAVFATFFVSMDELPAYDGNNEPILNKIDYFKSLKYDWCDHLGWPLLIAATVPIVAHLLDETFIKLLKQLITKLGRWLRKRFATEKLYTAQEMEAVEAQLAGVRRDFEEERRRRTTSEDQVETLRKDKKDVAEAHQRDAELLQTSIDNMTTQRDSALGDLRTSREEMTKLGIQYDEAKDQLMVLQDQLDRRAAEIQKANKQNELSQGVFVTLQRERDAVTKRNSELINVNNKLDQRVTALRRRYHADLTTLKGSSDQLEELLSERFEGNKQVQMILQPLLSQIQQLLDRYHRDDLIRSVRESGSPDEKKRNKKARPEQPQSQAVPVFTTEADKERLESMIDDIKAQRKALLALNPRSPDWDGVDHTLLKQQAQAELDLLKLNTEPQTK